MICTSMVLVQLQGHRHLCRHAILDTEMQRQDEAYVATSKMSVMMSIVLPMQKQLKLICQIFHFAYKIQQNFTICNGVKTLESTSIF